MVASVEWENTRAHTHTHTRAYVDETKRRENEQKRKFVLDRYVLFYFPLSLFLSLSLARPLVVRIVCIILRRQCSSIQPCAYIRTFNRRSRYVFSCLLAWQPDKCWNRKTKQKLCQSLVHCCIRIPEGGNKEWISRKRRAAFGYPSCWIGQAMADSFDERLNTFTPIICHSGRWKCACQENRQRTNPVSLKRQRI